MKITAIYGSPRNPSTTCSMAREVIKYFPTAEVEEFFLSDINLPYCKGCLACVQKGFSACPHTEYMQPILKSMIACDLLILASPVYVMHLNGQMKTFLDHTAPLFLIHRAEKSMFQKQALVVSSAAGPVFKGTLKEMKKVLNFYGISKVYNFGAAVASGTWENIKPEKIEKIKRKAEKLANTIEKNKGKIKPCFEVKKWFFISRKLNIKYPVSKPDTEYWEKQGWLKKGRPWK